MSIDAVKSIVRGLGRDRTFVLVNVAGLSIATAFSIVIGLYLHAELTFDRHHERHDRIYRVENEFRLSATPQRLALSPPLLGPVMMRDYTEVEAFVRFRRPLTGLTAAPADHFIRASEQGHYWRNVFAADASVFEVFTHDVIHGDPRTALTTPGSAAVSRSFAHAYFGAANPIGELLLLEDGAGKRITLVYEDLPQNTHLRYDVLFAYTDEFPELGAGGAERQVSNWNPTDYTYLLMADGFDPSGFARIAEDFYARREAELGISSDTPVFEAWLQPLADVHLHSQVDYDEPTGDKSVVYTLAGAALAALWMASANFAGLAAARSGHRVRSIGMRRILGAGRGSLALQFLVESVLICLMAVVLAGVLVELFRAAAPVSGLFGSSLSSDVLHSAQAWILAGLAALLLGVLSGVYPALVLTSLPPQAALSGRPETGRGVQLRQGLVFIQITLATTVLAVMLLMASQLQFVARYPLGFDPDNRIVVRLRGVDVIRQIPEIRNALLNSPDVFGVSSSDAIMGQATPRTPFLIEDNDGVMRSISTNFMSIGEGFLEVMGLRLSRGRDFDFVRGTDVRAGLIVNESLVWRMGWTDPLGKRITLASTTMRVIGVVEDFNFRSLRHPVEPFILLTHSDTRPDRPAARNAYAQRLLLLHVADTDLPRMLAFIETALQQFDPAHSLDFQLLEDAIAGDYDPQHRLLRFAGVFSGIAILIAGLGLYSLMAFLTEQRSREIAIRKVLGESILQLMGTLARPVLALTAAATVTGSILAHVLIQVFLAGFAYRTDVQASAFLTAAAIVGTLVIMPVVLVTMRTARRNPSAALQRE